MSFCSLCGGIQKDLILIHSLLQVRLNGCWNRFTSFRDLWLSMTRGSVAMLTVGLVPPIRIERTTNGLGNRCSIQLSYGGMAKFQLLSLVGWLVSSTKCSRRVPLKVFVKGFRRLRQVPFINRVVSLPHLF
jgi:hypothetical protein